MPQLFEESLKRVRRAQTHALGIMDTLIRRVGNREAYYVVLEDRGNGDFSFRMRHHFPTEEIDTLSLQIGEFFYQLRAALDGAMWEAHILLGGTEFATYANKLDFPIHAEIKHFKKAALHKVNLPQELKIWLSAIQPCHALQSSAIEVAAFANALLVIHNCARKDRHRRLHLMAMLVTDSTAVVTATPPARLTYVQSVPANILQNDSEIVRFGVEGGDASNVQAEGSFMIEISVKEVPTEQGVHIGMVLKLYTDIVILVIAEFQKAFS